MKNRVLSVMLSIGIILSNFSNGLLVIAEDSETTEIQQNLVTTDIQAEDMLSQTVDDVKEEVNNIEETSSGVVSNEEVSSEIVELKVVFDTAFADIYFGQDKPDFLELTENSSYLPKYYHFELPDGSDNVSEELYRALSDYYSFKYVRDDGIPNGDDPDKDTVYNIQIELKEDKELPVEVDGKKYYVNTDLDKKFIVKEYIPTESVVVSVIDYNGVKYLESENTNFSISQDVSADSFNGSRVIANKVDESGYYYYYLKNENKADAVYYGAISCKYSINPEKPQINNIVEISGDGLDIDKGAFNKPVEITLTGYAKSNNAYFILYNGNDIISGQINSEIENDSNQNTDGKTFKAKYKIELKENTCIDNLKARMYADGWSDITPLIFKQGNKQRDKFILENIAPEININSKDENSNIVCFGAIDKNSGISKVSVIGPDSKEITTTEENGLYKVDLSHAKNSGSVKVKIIATDKAGNSAEKVFDKKVDGNAPNIKAVSYQYKNTDGEWTEYSVNSIKTVFSKTSLRMLVTAEDDQGIKEVTLWQNNKQFGVMGFKDGVYYYDFNNQCRYNNLTIEVSDYFNNSGTKIIDLIAIDSTKPTVSIEKPEVSSNGENNWFNKDSKEILVKLNDSYSGISNVKIYEITSEGAEKKIKEVVYTENNTEEEIRLPISDFTDGQHIIKVEVSDNAGNSNDKEFDFYTDFEKPKGTIGLATDPDAIIDGKKWFKLENEIEFIFKIDDDNPYKVDWIVEGSTTKNGTIFFDGENELSLTSTESGAALDENGDHKYTISAVIYDKANNSVEIGPLEVYKDFNAPKIEDVNVSSVESGLDKVLRILSFGVYSNCKIKYTVTASDKNDSGLSENAAWLATKKNAIYPDDFVKMDYDDEKYSYIIPENSTLYPELTEKAAVGQITVRVTDRIGRYSYYSQTDNNNANHMKYMIEQIKPEVSISIPESDGLARTDNMIWYKSDKNVDITIQDKDSGIYNIDVRVNDIPINFIIEDAVSSSSVPDTQLHEYHFSTDNIMTYLTETNNAPQDGHYTIKVEAEDNSGNKNVCEEDYYIDKKAPDVVSIDFSVASADNHKEASEFIDVLEYGFYFKTSLIATVNVSDETPSSGLHRIEYNLVEYNNGVKGNEYPGKALINENGQASFDIPNHFKGQIFVKSFDYVENESEEKTPQSFVVDTPERHELEQHIEINGFNSTAYTDSEGHPLYDTNVNLTVKISDSISGIRNISYSLYSELENQDTRTITISNTGNTVGQNLGDGWQITAMDENLVTEVTRTYIFSYDNNNIQLSFAMTDRANNTSEKISDIFSIDQTAPVINVKFDSPAGNNEYYREKRTATITVIERNFDTSRIIASITNDIGHVPGLSFTSTSNTEHTATLVFDEGDYTFGIEGTDRCNHIAAVNYSGGNERKFYVDLTDPTETDNFDQFINDLENSFKIDKEMTFTITEHNFVPSLVNIRVYRTKAGQELTTGNREDCTSEYISSNGWNSVGDTHTLSLIFNKDYVYQVVISATDASGRTMPEKTSPVFEIDKTVPVLKTPANLDVLVYTSKNTEKSATPIKFFDDNIASVHYSVVSYQMKLNEDNVGYDMNVASKEFDVKSDSVVISNEFFNQDGIYEVKCVAYDVAGNTSEESTHTFVIQRDTDFLVYIPNSNKDNHTGLYKFDKTGIRSADFEDIEIITYITNDKSFEVQVDGTEVTATDLEVKKDERRINQVDMYDIILKNSYIAQNYSADTIDTDLALNAVAISDDSEQVITLGHIYIDNVKPVGEYESALQNLGMFDGFYGVESRTVMIEGVSPDIDLNRCEIQANDMVLRYETSGFNYDEDAHTISFNIEKGYTDIRPTLVDNAGNINNLTIIKKVYVGGLFARWWYLFIVGSLVLLAIPSLIIISVRRKKEC